MLGVFLYSFPFSFLRQGLCKNWELIISSTSTGQNAPGIHSSLALPPPSIAVTDKCNPIWHFVWVLEFKTHDFLVIQQALYPLNYLTSPDIFLHVKYIEFHQKTHRCHSNCSISIAWGSLPWKVKNNLYFLNVSLCPLFSLFVDLNSGILYPLRCGDK